MESNRENQITDKILINDGNNLIELNGDQTISELFTILRSIKENKYLIDFTGKKLLEITKFQKEDLISGKKELSALDHPYFHDKDNKDIIPLQMATKDKQILTVEKSKRILLFSPHPDDEVLGACGLLQTAFNQQSEIKVIYLTSGKGAGDPGIRQGEAVNGIKQIGGDINSLNFVDIPFYDCKSRTVTEKDFVFVKNIINENKPDQIFICADVFDPNGTHKRCFEILLEVLKEYKDVEKYFYYSIWYWPRLNEYTHILPYQFETYKKKIYAMLEHKSQLDHGHMGADPRPFYQRATTRDKSFGKTHGYDFCEVYYKFN